MISNRMYKIYTVLGSCFVYFKSFESESNIFFLSLIYCFRIQTKNIYTEALASKNSDLNIIKNPVPTHRKKLITLYL